MVSRVGGWASGVVGTEFLSGIMKSSGDNGWCFLHNNMKVLNIPAL